MHVRTYSTNFAPPHFAAGGIPKNSPHGKWKITLLTFIFCLFTPSWWSFFSFSRYTKHTLLHGLIFFVTYGKDEGMQFQWSNFSFFLYACET